MQKVQMLGTYVCFTHRNAATRAREFALECLKSPNRPSEIAAMFCLMYEDNLTIVGRGSAVARMILHIFSKFGLDTLNLAAERGEAVARSSDLNHLGKIITKCIKITPRVSSVSFDFAEFTTVALSYIGTACAVSDVLETMRKTYVVPGNDLLALLDAGNERALLGELLSKGSDLNIIPSL
jgi:hypothetical protein